MMNQLSVFIYQLLINAYGLAIRLAAYFNPKARLWVDGRVNIFSQLAKVFQTNKAPIIWIHCASLGEFEQGRPILNYFKNNCVDYKILLTFFSPSGYEIRKNFQLADFVFYLPLDSPKNANQFLDIVQPKLVFFIKYDFWYFYLNALQQRNILHYLIAGTFREKQFFFRSYANWYLTIIQNFTHLFLQDEYSGKLLASKGFTNFTITGDPRIDQVVITANQSFPIPIIEEFKRNRKLLILGSTHPKDVETFKAIFENMSEKPNLKNWCFMFAPHEINESNIAPIKTILPNNTFQFSTKATNKVSRSTIIFILDTIGLLGNAYQYANAVYIGGGFDKSIHNILEPAVFGVPISIGPAYHQFTEAKELIDRGGVQVLLTSDDMLQWISHIRSVENREKMGIICKTYINQNVGSTEKIINYLNKKNVL